MKISKILRSAADEYLWPRGYMEGSKIGSSFACFAVEDACYDLLQDYDALDWLRNDFGCPFYRAFDEFETVKQQQGARFLMLHFAALVAEDEGL